MKKNTKT